MRKRIGKAVFLSFHILSRKRHRGTVFFSSLFEEPHADINLLFQVAFFSAVSEFRCFGVATLTRRKSTKQSRAVVSVSDCNFFCCCRCHLPLRFFFCLASFSSSLSSSLPLFTPVLNLHPSIPLELCKDLRANSMASEGGCKNEGSTNR